jgi:type II secretory pathway pseudopilin PulG
MMVVVAIIAVLASIAVYLFRRSSNKAKASEVRVMFAEFKTREEAHFVEFGAYTATAADDATFHPPSPSGAHTTTSLHPLPAEWRELRMAPSDSLVRCSYLARAGDASTPCVNCGVADGVFGFNAALPNEQWYYLIAECDWDGAPTNSLYFARSDRDGVAVENAGR